MAKSPLPPPATLRQLLDYDPRSGKLFWKARTDGFSCKRSCSVWNARFAGKEVGWENCAGYTCLSLWGKKLRAHRVAWAITYDVWPENEIDHINGCPSDNRIKNLREVTHAENGKNVKTPMTNKSGQIGVYRQRGASAWRAEIKVNGRRIHLGYFEKFSDAVRARTSAEAEYKFHANHGRQ